jgi:hypothetical protein
MVANDGQAHGQDAPSRPAGPIVLFGSGEASPTARRVHAAALGQLTQPIRACVLETPAGFEPNSARVAGRLAEFLRHRLAQFDVQVEVVPARKRGTPLSPDDPEVVAPLLKANYVVLGPGSPTYAAAQLAGSLAWHAILARHRLGAPLVLASAAAIAASAQALPVYEIYKVGEDLGWKAGLNLLGPFGRKVAIVPHWDNREGGSELDTSHSFMGQERFERLLGLLPSDVDIVGIDEHTALMLDFAAGMGVVFGRGGVSWLQNGSMTRLETGTSMPLDALGLARQAESMADIPRAVWDAACRADLSNSLEQEPPEPPEPVRALVAARAEARANGDWGLSDRLRLEIAAAGWQVRDTPEGPVVVSD